MKCLLLSKSIAEYTKKDIDNGFCPKEIYEICCGLRTCFCLSYAIRKDNDFYLIFIENEIAIKFIGRELRFLGPDERSQALLLYKALKKRKPEMNKNIWIESTPGIYIKKGSDFNEVLKELISAKNSNLYIVQNQSTQSSSNRTNDFMSKQRLLEKQGIYIFSFDEISPSNLLQNCSYLNLKNETIPTINLKNIKKISDQILMLNYLLDVKNASEDIST